MIAGAFSDIAIKIILGLLTAGIGAAAQATIQSGRWVKVSESLDKIYHQLKRIPHGHHHPHAEADVARSARALGGAEKKALTEAEGSVKVVEDVDDLILNP